MWSAVWDTVRDIRLAPMRYITMLLEHLSGETDEQISRTILSRGAVALDVYLPDDASAPLRPRWEQALLARLDDPTLGYGLRKDALDRLIATARTPLALARLRDLLAGRAKFVDGAIHQPTRWAIVRRLIAVGAPDAAMLFAAEQRLDRSSEAVKDAFVARAATPDRSVKASYFSRYFDDAALNEAWASESLDAFNTIEEAALTLPFLRPALDRLEWIRQNRRIFFLPAWIDAFIGGQHDPSALQVVDRFLDAHPALPIDVRRKLLTARDELALTVRIRAATFERKGPSMK
jgi:aminopeptidase N